MGGAHAEPAFAMSAMIYNEELLGTAAGGESPSEPQTCGVAPPFESAVASFDRPGPDVLSRAIPVVFIGRNRNGAWVARDAEAKFGGLFWRKGAALRFARASAGPAGFAAVFPQARFELDLENNGNPLLGRLATLKRLVARPASRLKAVIRKLT